MLKLRAVTKEGVFKFMGSRAWVKMRLNQLPEGEWDVIIQKHFEKRSLPQNAYYWTVVVPLVFKGLRDVGFDEVESEEDAHDVLKAKFFKKIIYSPQRDTLEREVSTTKFTKAEFSERLELIWKWAFEYLGVYIPPPNEQTSLQLGQ